MKKILSTIAVIVVLGSCTPRTSVPSIFSDKSCGTPCWNNIVVGQTDKQEFLNIISALPVVDQDSVIIRSLDSGGLFDEEAIFEVYRIQEDESTLVRMAARFSQGKIVLLSFQGKLGLTFQELVDTFGEPNFVSSLWTFDGGINIHVINSIHGVEVTQYF